MARFSGSRPHGGEAASMNHSPDAPGPTPTPGPERTSHSAAAPAAPAGSAPAASASVPPADRTQSGAASSQPQGRWATEKIVVPLLQTIITGLVGIWLGWFLTGRVT